MVVYFSQRTALCDDIIRPGRILWEDFLKKGILGSAVSARHTVLVVGAGSVPHGGWRGAGGLENQKNEK